MDIGLWRYRAQVRRVVDGDTLDLDVDLGFHLRALIRVRLQGVDTWEVRGPERPAGLEAKAFVERWLEVDQDHVIVETTKTGKFGRWLARITRPSDGADLGVDLLAAGHGVAVDDHGRRLRR
ncbi:MAG: nuclease [Actinomyces sp.]|nr:MAG: nuclease [Actinomyces sp.]